MGIYGYCNGQVGELLAPADSEGRICGYNSAVKDYPNYYITDLNYALAHPTNTNDIFKYGVCVKACPSATSATGTVDCVVTKNSPTCTY
jgi:hypothetical protein